MFAALVFSSSWGFFKVIVSAACRFLVKRGGLSDGIGFLFSLCCESGSLVIREGEDRGLLLLLEFFVVARICLEVSRPTVSANGELLMSALLSEVSTVFLQSGEVTAVKGESGKFLLFSVPLSISNDVVEGGKVQSSAFFAKVSVS